MSPRHLRLAAVGGESTSEAWTDIPDNALVTFTLPKKTINGCLYGVSNLLEANRNMMLAVAAAQTGDATEVEKRIRFAFGDLVAGNSFAAQLHADIMRRARRANPRKVKS